MRRSLPRPGDWWRAGRTDCKASHARRLTGTYRARRRLTRRIWMGAGLLTLVHPELPVAVILALLSTFISFAVLDEAAEA